jgi:hypothetical protein
VEMVGVAERFKTHVARRSGCAPLDWGDKRWGFVLDSCIRKGGSRNRQPIIICWSRDGHDVDMNYVTCHVWKM